jgi:glutaredoxin-like YruB-family protein
MMVGMQADKVLIPAVLVLSLCVLVPPACEEEADLPAVEVPVEEQPAPAASERKLTGPMEGIYKFTDEYGVIHFVDSIEKVPKKYRKRARNPTGGAVSIIPSSSIDELLDKQGIDHRKYRRKGRKGKGSQAKSHGEVYLYTTSWCPACKRAKAFLRREGVKFTEKDVENNRANLEEMLKKSGGARGVPVIDVNGTIMRGFSARALKQALK